MIAPAGLVPAGVFCVWGVKLKLFLKVLRIYMKKGSMKYGGLDFEAE